jgi:hypothetical protein
VRLDLDGPDPLHLFGADLVAPAGAGLRQGVPVVGPVHRQDHSADVAQVEVQAGLAIRRCWFRSSSLKPSRTHTRSTSQGSLWFSNAPAEQSAPKCETYFGGRVD